MWGAPERKYSGERSVRMGQCWILQICLENVESLHPFCFVSFPAGQRLGAIHPALPSSDLYVGKELILSSGNIPNGNLGGS